MLTQYGRRFPLPLARPRHDEPVGEEGRLARTILEMTEADAAEWVRKNGVERIEKIPGSE